MFPSSLDTAWSVSLTDGCCKISGYNLRLRGMAGEANDAVAAHIQVRMNKHPDVFFCFRTRNAIKSGVVQQTAKILMKVHREGHRYSFWCTKTTSKRRVAKKAQQQCRRTCERTFDSEDPTLVESSILGLHEVRNKLSMPKMNYSGASLIPK